jgi:hypothetical protein
MAMSASKVFSYAIMSEKLQLSYWNNTNGRNGGSWPAQIGQPKAHVAHLRLRRSSYKLWRGGGYSEMKRRLA